MKILLLDNYDSFTYNLLHIVKEITKGTVQDIEVHRNDKISLDEIEQFDKILLSPGPGIPEEAGILLPLIERYAPTKSILGVCLGEQAIGQVFGARLINMKQVFHGICSDIHVIEKEEPLFRGLEEGFIAGRYHSWVISHDEFPDCLSITAEDVTDRQIMAISHKLYDVKGIQFHPESVLTPKGKSIIQNWLST